MKVLAVLSLIAVLGLTSSVSATFVTCQRDYKKIGCFQDKIAKVVMHTLLLNDRTGRLDWNRFEESLLSLACRCQQKAKEKKFKFFSIRYYGECWGGQDVKQFNKMVKDPDATSKDCVSHTYKECNDGAKQECAGTATADYVFELNEQDVDGGYSTWTSWNTCTKSCGWGTQARERSCNNPLPKGKGKDCEKLGPMTELKKCLIKHCPVDGGLSAWSKFTSCSKTCGPGTKTRTRTCTNPKPAHGGKGCSGKLSESQSCQLKPCPVDGGLSAWSKFTSCSKTCGPGTKTRTRTCTNPKPAHVGKGCSGKLSESQSCQLKPCPAPPLQTKIICEHRRGKRITCPNGKLINIASASYGRRSRKFCGYRRFYSLRCHSKISLPRVRQQCEGKRSCFLTASNRIFGDPCVRTVKYLEVKYRCRKSCERSAIACEHKRGKLLSCPSGKVIRVTYANYGRLSSTICGRNRNTNCKAKSSLRKVVAKCNNRQSCKIVASNSIFGDPCRGVVKYLHVKYRCKPRKKQVGLLCEHRGKKIISCASGRMHITSANYGRLSTSHCRFGFYRRTNCRARNSLAKVRRTCEGKKRCIIFASNRIFGDPCYGVVKYLEVHYTCK